MQSIFGDSSSPFVQVFDEGDVSLGRNETDLAEVEALRPSEILREQYIGLVFCYCLRNHLREENIVRP